MSFYFADKTWVEIERSVKNRAVIILPVGTTEEHGHHLPVSTDAVIARCYGDRLGQACEQAGISALVMESINYGFSMSVVRQWPGCPNISARTFADYIFDIISSIVQMGFDKIVVLDCHGNHDCLLRLVMREIADKHNVYIMTLSPMALSGKLYGQIKKDPEGDIHGGEWETSVMLYARPELVQMDKASNVDAIRCNTPLRGPVSAWGLQKTATGLLGDPTYATAELGEKLMDEATRKGLEMIELYREHTEKS